MLTILGCGNLNRSDDGVGVRVAQRLAARLSRRPVPGVQVFDCGTGGIDVMFRARGSTALIVIDASRTGSEPGTVYKVPGEVLESLPEPGYSLHDFRWDHALAVGRKIFASDFPTDVSVFLIEAADLSLGLELTAPVEAASERVYHTILDAAASWSAARHQASAPVDVTIRRGAVVLPAAIYEAWFAPRAGVVPFEKEGRICLLPVEQLAGGLLLKQKNAAGDRAVDLSEVLTSQGWDPWGTYTCQATWEPTWGALALRRPVLGDPP